MKVKINPHGNPLPECHGDFIDLALAEDLRLKKGECGLFSLGISIELPEGYYAELVPRSSTCLKYGVMQANSIGIIDHDFCGDDDIWKFAAYAIRDTEIPKGTRICQFRLVRCSEPIEFVKVDRLMGPVRGGFGSTGK